MEAAAGIPPGEQIPVDVWNADFTERARAWDVPLIPLDCLGLKRGDDGLLYGGDLVPLKSGAEAAPYLDREQARGRS